jgi:hypothetical protein
LIEQVAPIQLAIRLLIPEGSLLLELPEVREQLGPYDPHALCYPWRTADPAVDRLSSSLPDLIKQEERRHSSRREIFRRIWDLSGNAPLPDAAPRPSRATIPYLTEPWYC